ncbi:Beta-glucosidase B [Colletotrichum siamense]|uniref:Beta-glucosidase B n=1 Tax=Colletotrichum siamense TaxID=690259 RepID=UPI001872EF8E|nr:Beta-glucosidase B [Colletotrichum siamense]KAF5516043.1 Beta-glucosidase B [Colletotrichum siamense]
MLDTERHGRDHDPSKVPVTATQDAKGFADEKLKQMTLEEKILLLTGEDLWRTNPIPRLGISRIKTSDGPTGVRGGIFVDGVTAASLPSGVSLAATWDKQVIEDVSQVLIAEAKSKGVDVLLGPTVCIPRTPLSGRNFEAYSEDPFLTGKLAAQYINTIQAAGIGACVKHYAANDQENRRFFIDEKIPERALREIHLQPFQIAVRDSNPWSIMTAYNKVNGNFCSANHYLIRDILRGEWGWDGLVMSDWFGTNSVVPSLTAGLDLEMPGPVRRRGKHLLEAHRQGLVDSSFIDASASTVLELVHKTGKSKIPDWKEGPEQAVDLPEHRAILRRAGAEGIVLLKNEGGILPLKDLDGKTIAFIGPNANRSVATGGGSSNLSPHYRTTPFGSFSKEISSIYPTAKVVTKPGILTHRYLPLLEPSVMTNPKTGSPGFVLSLWRNMKHEGTPFMTEHRPSSNLVCYDGLPPELTTGERYSYRAKTILTPKTTGVHQFSLSSCGPGKLILDEKVIINIERRWWSPKSSLFMSYGSPEERVEVELKAGQSYELVLESISREPKPYDMTYTGMLEREEVQDGGRVGFLENPGDLDAMLQEAVDLASRSDIAIVVVGKDHEWETETSDMVSMDLPGQSNELVRAVVRANSRTIVINQTGSPITMPWVNEVPAIVQAWYQGQEQGNCIADILLGTTNPCGKLPITFPRRIEDTPSFDNYPGENDVVHYGENLYLGYRFYDHRKIEPLFPFGYGLSYTTFAYSNIRLSSGSLAVDETIEVQVDVTNTGGVDGKEVVEFYVSPVSKPTLGRPLRELKGWDKVFVRPGETATARATLDRGSISYWDDSIQKWVIEGNAVFMVSAAKDSRDEGLAAEFRSKAAARWVH